MAVVSSSMNGDIPNFAMGHKDDDSLVAGNLQEEVTNVSLTSLHTPFTAKQTVDCVCSRRQMTDFDKFTSAKSK